MQLGIIIYSNEPETVWNAFRFGDFALNRQDQVKVFLLAKGVECESIDTEKFRVMEQMQNFVDHGGEILACGTCIKLRNSSETELCPLSTMEDLYRLVDEADKVVSF